MIKRLITLSTQIQRKVNNSLALPGACITCSAAIVGHGLCAGCYVDLPANQGQCRRCALPLAFGTGATMICGECLRHPPPFDRVITPWRYEFPVNHMISRYKYRGQRALGQPLIQSLVERVRDDLASEPWRRPDLLIPSPMHRNRQRRRGFNQAEDIAEQLSRQTGVPWSVTLVRKHRQHEVQAGLGRQKRLANLRGSFVVDSPAPRRVAIVDDVITTGATARTLALALTKAGARHIEVWALARTPN